MNLAALKGVEYVSAFDHRYVLGWKSAHFEVWKCMCLHL